MTKVPTATAWGWKSDAKQCRIQSISQDVIFAASSEHKLPSKHLKLRVALKSLTGSRKFVEMLNRYGHCANFHTVAISYELVFPEVNGSSDAENNNKNTQEKATDDSETYPTTPGKSVTKNQLNLK